MTGAVQLGLDGEVWTVGSRPDDDYYRTPAWLARAGLAVAGRSPATVLDAGAGDGALTRAVISHAEGDWRRRPRVWAVELAPGRCPQAEGVEVVVGDFLTWRPPAWSFDLIVTNPPFRLWDDFVRRCLEVSGAATTVLALGFVNVLGGQSRAPWWRDNPPSRIHISPRRASFTADGQTDSRDCAWFEWAPEHRRAEMRWLETER